MTILDAYEPGTVALSFELFPPKSAESEAALWRNLAELVRFLAGPESSYCSGDVFAASGGFV